MSLRFDKDSHTYSVDGKTLPGVTSIIEDACQSFKFVPEQTLIPAQWRGTVVHRATELFDFGMLDWDTLDADLHGYVKSWALFAERIGFDLEYMEHRLHHPKYLYAGTLDRAGSVKWGRRQKAIIDIKTGAPVAGTALQTAAYQAALEASGEKYKLRLGVYLNPDGGEPNVVEHTNRQDLTVFLAMLKVYNWKVNR